MAQYPPGASVASHGFGNQGIPGSFSSAGNPLSTCTPVVDTLVVESRCVMQKQDDLPALHHAASRFTQLHLHTESRHSR